MKNIVLFFALFIFGVSLIYGQRTINNVTFEAAGGYSTSIAEFTDEEHDYFCKVKWNEDNPKAYNVDGDLLGDLDSPRGPVSYTHLTLPTNREV